MLDHQSNTIKNGNLNYIHFSYKWGTCGYKNIKPYSLLIKKCAVCEMEGGIFCTWKILTIETYLWVSQNYQTMDYLRSGT